MTYFDYVPERKNLKSSLEYLPHEQVLVCHLTAITFIF